MRRFIAAISTITVLTVAANTASSQPLPPTMPAAIEPPAVFIEAGPDCPVPAIFYSGQLLLGLPTGFRLQRSLNPESNSPWIGEAFLGLTVIFPDVGVGVRRRYCPIEGRRDALVVSPGVNVHLFYNPFHDSGDWLGGGPALGQAVIGDIDVTWQHTYGDRFGGEVGFKIGAGPAHFERWGVLPVFAVFAGWRY